MVDSRSLRVVFFGTPAFAVPAFEALRTSRHTVVAVVTQPDRPSGRGQNTTDAPVKARAVLAGLPILQPASLRDPVFVSSLAAFNADLGVVAAYGKILTEAVLALPRLGMVNVHASLLPKYRGAAPVHRSIIAGERETGVTIMRVVRALDAGPMLAATRRPVAPDETSEQVERDLAQMGASLLVSTIDGMTAGTVNEIPQDDGAATYAARLTKTDGLIDWSVGARRVHDLIRGLHPWPHAYTFMKGQRLILLRAAVSDTPARDAEGNAAGHPAAPGAILAAAGDDLRIACGDGILRVLELQAEGTRPMTVRDFLAGHRLMPGDRFTSTP
jgi:methionyl-tRNA formyltransferase